MRRTQISKRTLARVIAVKPQIDDTQKKLEGTVAQIIPAEKHGKYFGRSLLDRLQDYTVLLVKVYQKPAQNLLQKLLCQLPLFERAHEVVAVLAQEQDAKGIDCGDLLQATVRPAWVKTERVGMGPRTYWAVLEEFQKNTVTGDRE